MSEFIPGLQSPTSVPFGPSARAKPPPGATAPPERTTAQPAPEKREEPAEAPAPEVKSGGPFRITVDAETMRSITEVIDQSTGEVLFYLPPGYRPPDERNSRPDRREVAGLRR